MIYDIIIVGSGPAGMTSALYGSRAGYSVALITGSEMFGSLGKISNIENYPGFDSIIGYDLALKMYNQLDQFKKLTKYQFVNAVNYSIKNKKIMVQMDDHSMISGKSLIIAIGGKHKTAKLKNEENFFGKGISFCATCDGPLYTNKDVVILGGGNSAMDFAITLSKYCKKVTIIHRRNDLRADKTMIEKVKKIKNVEFILNTNVLEIVGNDKFSGLTLLDNNKNQTFTLYFDGCFYALGFEKNDLICFSNDSEQKQHTNVFHVGDCIDEKYRQVITACGDGCKTALDCISYLKGL